MPGLGRLIRAAALDVGPLRRHREFRLLYVGQAVSFTGSMLTYVAIPYQVYALTGSTFVVGLLGFASLAPLLVTALIGGALADARDRRRLVLAADATLLALSAVLLVNALLGQSRVWVLFVVAAGMSAAGGLQRPPLDALVPRLVSREELPAASALESLRGNVAQIAGPALGGRAHRRRRPRRDVRGRRRELRRLARGARTHARRPAAAGRRAAEPRPDRRGLALRAVAAGADRDLRRRHQRDAVRLPRRPVPGRRPAPRRRRRRSGSSTPQDRSGALLFTVTSGWTARVTRHGRAVAVSAGAYGVAVALFGLSGSLVPCLVALAAAGAADMASGIFRMTLWNQTIPDAMRGRLAGIEQLSWSIGPTLGDVGGRRRRRRDVGQDVDRVRRRAVPRRHGGDRRPAPALLALRRCARRRGTAGAGLTGGARRVSA